jgi:hypothetical protein
LPSATVWTIKSAAAVLPVATINWKAKGWSLGKDQMPPVAVFGGGGGGAVVLVRNLPGWTLPFLQLNLDTETRDILWTPNMAACNRTKLCYGLRIATWLYYERFNKTMRI